MKQPFMWKVFVVSVLAGTAWLAALGEDYKIVQSEKMFSQNEITIKQGDSVIFVNGDEVAHNVYSTTPGMGFDLQRQAPGASSKLPFNKLGDVEVLCSIHPKMKLMIHVVK